MRDVLRESSRTSVLPLARAAFEEKRLLNEEVWVHFTQGSEDPKRHSGK
jgi:hypothetical protein